MADELLRVAPATKPRDFGDFGCGAREIAVRLLAWTMHRPADHEVDVLVEELMQSRLDAHWTTTQGNGWALFALTQYAERVERRIKSADGAVTFSGQSTPFHLADKITSFEKTFPIARESSIASLLLANPDQRLLFTQTKLQARPKVIQQPRQDRGYAIQRSYAKLNDAGEPVDLKELRVGDRVLVTLSFEVRQFAHYVAIDDALPSLFEAINPEFKTQQTRHAADLAQDWVSDFRELRTDRALFFRNHLDTGRYTIRYLARVRAAGTATAPAAKIEEMYHPDRFGLTETTPITALPLD